MLPIVTDGVAYVHWSMAELIKMSFGTWTWVGRRNHVLDGGADLPMRRNNFETETGWPTAKFRHCRELCKNACSDRYAVWDAENHVSDGSAHWHDLVNTTEPSV